MTRYFTKDHEWIAIDGDTGTVGITEYAQAQLGDITFVELPEEGRALSRGETAAVVESVKAASDVYAPLAGTVTGTNPALEDEPEQVNSDAEGEGWLFRLSLGGAPALDGLMDRAAYEAYIAEL